MFRGWKGIALACAIGAALFVGVVLYAVNRPPRPGGYSGLTFSPLTPSAAMRTPLLARGGALVFAVTAKSPADTAGIKPDEVLAAIDGTKITSARQAAQIIRAGKVGDHVSLTLYDITQGEIKPRTVALTFSEEPAPIKKFSVRPQRALAKEYFFPPFPAANASWSKRIYRGATIRPLTLDGLGAGQCNAFAPPEWRVAAHAPDNSLFHVMANQGFAHALYKSGNLDGASAEDFARKFLETTFGSPVALTPARDRVHSCAVNKQRWRGIGGWRGVADIPR